MSAEEAEEREGATLGSARRRIQEHIQRDQRGDQAPLCALVAPGY